MSLLKLECSTSRTHPLKSKINFRTNTKKSFIKKIPPLSVRESFEKVLTYGIWGVAILVKKNCFSLIVNTSGNADVRVWRVKRCLVGRSNYLCSQSTQNVCLFCRHLFRHANNTLISFDCRCEGQANTGVARSCFNNFASWLKHADFFSVEHHSLPDSILRLSLN